VTVGRLVHQKGHEILIEAHAKLIRQGLPHQVVIIGEGPLLDEQKALARRLGVEHSVHFLGFQANPYRFMSRATVFALPSRCEAFSTALLDAMCCGAPAGAADCPSGPRELLQGGRCGLLVPTEDPGALPDALARLLPSGELRRRFSQLSTERSSGFDL